MVLGHGVTLLCASATARSFGVSLKGIRLPCGHEQVVYTRNCTADEAPCTMQHWWSGGTFAGYTRTRVIYHIDEGKAPTVNLPIGPAHGFSPDSMDDNGPWSAGALFGKTGVGLHDGGPSHGSGLFNTFHVPFERQINISVALGCNETYEYFWLILRGRTHAKIVLPGGLELPRAARLRSFESSALGLPPSAFLPVFNTSAPVAQHPLTGGALLFASIAVRSPRGAFQFLEGCVRASDAAATAAAKDSEWLLSSGTEDYFLGTFYFDKGQYFNPLAGVTSLCPQPDDGNPRPAAKGCMPSADGTISFSAYRLHAGHDPLTFEAEGLAVSWRNGEPGHGHGPAAVNASAFALVYVW
jgi:hypothetical protein